MADTFNEKCTKCAKVCGLSFIDCALRVLIGWADHKDSADAISCDMFFRACYHCVCILSACEALTCNIDKLILFTNPFTAKGELD